MANRATIISIIATAIIMGLSIGLTSYFNPQKIKSSLEQHADDVKKDKTMTTMCTNIQRIMNQSVLDSNENNVQNYNIQRLHGQCYLLDENNKDLKPIELLRMNGCGNIEGTSWRYKDPGMFEFCDLKNEDEWTEQRQQQQPT
tara:strand:+ start:826 stop:1254 length:429 start_codon:yes stop_codon:yes gene_type:complete